MTVLESFNLCVCARAGIGGPYALRGGTAFLWAGNLSAVVPSVSSHRRDCSLRKSTCGLFHSDYVRYGRETDRDLRRMTDRAGVLIKNEGNTVRVAVEDEPTECKWTRYF